MKRKKSVVLLTDCFKGLEGGAERQIFELSKRLDKEEYVVTIASLECEGEAPRDMIESAGCRLVTFPVKRIYGLSGILEGLRFIKFLKRERVDILQTYHFSSDIWGALMAKIAGVRTIISNRRDMGFWRGQRHIQAYKMINRFVNKIIVNAQAIKTLFIKEENIEERKLKVIHNGIALQGTGHRTHDTRLRKELNIKEADIIVIHVANIKPVKGHSYLIKAFAKIIPRHSNIKLLLIGEDKLDGQLKSLAEELGIAKNVVFLGKRDDVDSLVQLANICMLPSLSEGMSNTIMEYMVAGKPVIATRVGGNSELVEHGVNGLLVEKANEKELASALLELIQDSDKCVEMGKQGRRKITEGFSVQKMVQSYERLFEELMAS